MKRSTFIAGVALVAIITGLQGITACHDTRPPALPPLPQPYLTPAPEGGIEVLGDNVIAVRSGTRIAYFRQEADGRQTPLDNP